MMVQTFSKYEEWFGEWRGAGGSAFSGSLIFIAKNVISLAGFVIFCTQLGKKSTICFQLCAVNELLDNQPYLSLSPPPPNIHPSFPLSRGVVQKCENVLVRNS
jgi:hypothetical protein